MTGHSRRRLKDLACLSLIARFWLVIIFSSLFGLFGCATTNTPVAAPPLAEDLAWSTPTPVAPPAAEPPESNVAAEPSQARSAKEKVYAWSPGETYKVDVPVGAPIAVLLQPGEQFRDVGDGDRAPLAEGEKGNRWEFQRSYSGSGAAGRPVVMITVPKAGLTNGLIITTTKHLYSLDLKSVTKTSVRFVRWTYPDEPVAQAKAPARLWPDPAQPQRYHVGYEIMVTEPRPVWAVRQVVDDGHKTYLIFPPTVTTVDAPLIRLVGAQGPEMVNARQAGNVVILDRLFNRAELRLGAGKTAEVVTVQRQAPRTIACPGDPECPVWPDAAPVARAHP